MSKAADLVEHVVQETLTYYNFPDIHWQKIRTSNPLEQIIKEIPRAGHVLLVLFQAAGHILVLPRSDCATLQERHGRRSAT